MNKEIERRIAEYRRANKIGKSKINMIGRLKIKYKHVGEKEWVDLGIVSEAIVTQGAIAQIISVLQGGSATTLQNFKFHASGTGTAAESAMNISLGAEVETRDTGIQLSAAPGNYETSATHLYTSDHAITEHGLFSASSGGVLFDRSKFSPILVSAGTQISFTYDLQIFGS